VLVLYAQSEGVEGGEPSIDSKRVVDSCENEVKIAENLAGAEWKGMQGNSACDAIEPCNYIVPVFHETNRPCWQHIDILLVELY
jgi:hypothetical protein